MVIGITIMSCKKTDEEKIVTLDEMKLTAAKANEIKSLFTLNAELLSFTKQRVLSSSFKELNKATTSTSNNLNINDDFNKAKTRGDYILILDKINPQKGELIIDNMEKQQSIFKKFIDNNPQFKKFTEIEQKEILSFAFNNIKNNSVNTSLSILNNSNFKIEQSDCMGDFNNSYNRCTDTFNSDMFDMYIGVVAASFSGPVGGGIGIGAGIIYSVKYYIELNTCIELAGNALYNCAYIIQ